jgi:hypothetical protein
MVRAILDGSKTQTRRVIHPQPDYCGSITCSTYEPLKVNRRGNEYPGAPVFGFSNEDQGWVCPYGKPGDRLWVRETWRTYLHPELCDTIQYKADMTCLKPKNWDTDIGFQFSNDCEYADGKWRPSIHMPRWASRITLEITDVRVQRVQEISNDDAIAEGEVSVAGFMGTWEALYFEIAPWSVNPWVWCITFRRVQP